MSSARYKLVCYYTNWSWYRPGLGKYTPEDIDPTLCTHIVYGFAVLSDDGLITAHDSWADFDNRKSTNYLFAVKIKWCIPLTIIMVDVGSQYLRKWRMNLNN